LVRARGHQANDRSCWFNGFEWNYFCHVFGVCRCALFP
jgi:hypothetical protein